MAGRSESSPLRSGPLPSGEGGADAAGRSPRSPRPLIDAGLDSRRAQQLWLAALALAALIAGLAVLLRDGGGSADPSRSPFITLPEGAPVEAGLRVQVALPGVGAGAPGSVASLGVSLGEGQQAGALQSAGDARVALTASRYARHLAADLVTATRATVIAPETADAVQVALAIASSPQLLFVAVAGDDEVLSESALAARLGLGAGEALPSYFSYEIQRGDTLEKIARRFGIASESVLFNNFELGDGSLLTPGGSLTIPTRDGLVYNVRLGDTLFAIVENFAADMEATLAFEGNNLSSANELIGGTTILLVGGSASAAAGGVAGFASGPVFAIPDFQWPLGGVLSDFFGAARSNMLGFHTGIDVSAPTGTFVGAAAPGIVVQAGWEGSFGNLVTVDHGGGVLTRYAHMDHINVFLGEAVDPGDLIGFVGNTGLSFGAHLHFEIVMGGTFVNPLVWLNS